MRTRWYGPTALLASLLLILSACQKTPPQPSPGLKPAVSQSQTIRVVDAGYPGGGRFIVKLRVRSANGLETKGVRPRSFAEDGGDTTLKLMKNLTPYKEFNPGTDAQDYTPESGDNVVIPPQTIPPEDVSSGAAALEFKNVAPGQYRVVGVIYQKGDPNLSRINQNSPYNNGAESVSVSSLYIDIAENFAVTYLNDDASTPTNPVSNLPIDFSLLEGEGDELVMTFPVTPGGGTPPITYEAIP